MEEIDKTACQTITYDENGNKVLKSKRKYETLDEAIAACKIVNARPDRVHKIVSYKCSVCHKYHTGRNGNVISDKERAKLEALSKTRSITRHSQPESPIWKNNNKENWDNAQFKIVGKIDLDKIPKK